MSTGAALLIAAVVAVLIVAAWSRPARKAVAGWVSRDRKGRLTIALSSGRRKKSRSRRGSKKGRGRR